ncbi:hypothetical protein PTSG_12875 [Salpingoeca rosetta]|uniref:Mechanosensitive ion channel MscS domain-containing protein n=1 Tax=Salpingoeca rosetta (strain ATCC 50818 / BSB-021) TaxID=946362 RepID=F2UME1_SALR5|nr:uncharacterized protein PTSG_12875 [Salpingoeca rosetta]EGD78290.1 hypothetical protein PTSG_12875 [Salpingoeca rosetta]|eukprot:XP_004989613.1 hypothetical protein PTSG_12875 [Salpingoeca rosetta]
MMMRLLAERRTALAAATAAVRARTLATALGAPAARGLHAAAAADPRKRRPEEGTGWRQAGFAESGSRRHLASTPPPSANHKQQKKNKLWLLASTFDKILARTNAVPDPDMRRLLSRTGAVAAYVGLAATALGTMGVDTSALVAGLSVGGITIGFAARDLASNYIAGLMLVTSKPFRSGDRVIIGRDSDGFMGIVTGIDLRYVHIKPLDPQDTSELLVPNSFVFSSVIRTYNPRVDPLEEDDDESTSSSSGSSWFRRKKQGTANLAGSTAEPSLSSPDTLAATAAVEGGAVGGDTATSDAAVQQRPRLQEHTPEFVDVINVAYRELSALRETQLRSKYASLLRDVPDPHCQKVLLWLASEESLSNAGRPEWTDFVASNGGVVPDWLPTAFRTAVTKAE